MPVKNIGLKSVSVPDLPENIIEAVRQAVSDSDGHQWAVGDLLAGIVDELAGVYSACGVRNPRAWIIGKLSSGTGSDASTLRDRETMARFYPIDVRAEYDALTYHQLRACKSAGPDGWREAADWALANLPAPVAVIRERVKNGGKLPPAWAGRWGRLKDIAEQIANDGSCPPSVRLICRLILHWD